MTICDELETIKTSLQNITGSLSNDEQLIIQYDINSGSIDVKSFLDDNNISYISYSFDGDYGKMKNNILSNVTTQWVFHLDGDEYIETGSLEINRNLVNKNHKKLDGFFIPRNEINTTKNISEGTDYHLRLFKNRNWIKWNGSVHEGIAGCEQIEMINDYQIQHLRTEQQISASINL
jgi:hypothetical protein